MTKLTNNAEYLLKKAIRAQEIHKIIKREEKDEIINRKLISLPDYDFINIELEDLPEPNNVNDMEKEWIGLLNPLISVFSELRNHHKKGTQAGWFAMSELRRYLAHKDTDHEGHIFACDDECRKKNDFSIDVLRTYLTVLMEETKKHLEAEEGPK